MGVVYLAVNESLPGLVKIGKTDRTGEERMEEFSKGFATPVPFRCVFERKVSNPAKLEGDLHDVFAYCRLYPNRELFAVDWRAVAVVLLILEKEDNIDTRQISEVLKSAIKGYCDINPSPTLQGNQSGTAPGNIKERYKRFVQGKVKRRTTPGVYANALDHLRQNHKVDVWEMTDIETVHQAHRRLRRGGNLYHFNCEYNAGAMGAAVGQYIAFLESENSG